MEKSALVIVTFCRVRPAALVNELTATTRTARGHDRHRGRGPDLGRFGRGRQRRVAAGEHRPARGTGPPIGRGVGARSRGSAAEPGRRVGGSRSMPVDQSRARPRCCRQDRGSLHPVAPEPGRRTCPDCRRFPGSTTSISVFVDDIDQAVSRSSREPPISCLRDWDNEGLAELRQAMLPSISSKEPPFP